MVMKKLSSEEGDTTVVANKSKLKLGSSNLNKLLSHSESLLILNTSLRNHHHHHHNDEKSLSSHHQPAHLNVNKINTYLNNNNNNNTDLFLINSQSQLRNSTSSLKDDYLKRFLNKQEDNEQRAIKTSSISITTLNNDTKLINVGDNLVNYEDDDEEEDDIAGSSSLSSSSESTNPKLLNNTTSIIKSSPSSFSSDHGDSSSNSSNSFEANNNNNNNNNNNIKINIPLLSNLSFSTANESSSFSNNLSCSDDFDLDQLHLNDEMRISDNKANRYSDITVKRRDSGVNLIINDDFLILNDAQDDEIMLSCTAAAAAAAAAEQQEQSDTISKIKASVSESQLTLTPPALPLATTTTTTITTRTSASTQIEPCRHRKQLSCTISNGKSTISSANSLNLACEVASLSSLSSNYSQFDFINTNKTSVSPTPPTNNSITTSSSYNQISNNNNNNNKSNNSNTSNTYGITSFFFSNSLFGNKKQKETLCEKNNVELKKCESQSSLNNNNNNNNQYQSVSFSNKTTKTKFDLASKLFSLNPLSTNKNTFSLKSSTPATSSSNTVKLVKTTQMTNSSSSSSRSSSDQNSPHRPQSPALSNEDSSSTCGDNLSLKTNHSYNNLTVSDFQLPSSVLIFENRPSNLPAKSQQEALKHKQEYEKMVEIAKKKEKKENELKQKKYEQQIKKEDFMANSLKIWNNEILKNWDELKNEKRTHQLWWHGLPPPIRGKVWKLAVGNEMNLTKESYYFYEKKAKQKLELLTKAASNPNDLNESTCSNESVELIKLDVSRTFPQLCFFQKDGPYHDALHSVLGAYACYNTKVGYVQGMSFLTAILLLNMEAPDAFICLANLLNVKYLFACFCMDQTKMNRYFRVHQILLQHNIPKLYQHFEEQKVKPDLYLIEWIFTLFSKSLPLDVVSRVWDVFFRDKEEFLFKASLGLLNLYKDTLLQIDFIHIVQFLTKLPENINSTQLFKSIEQMSTDIDDTYFKYENLINEIVNNPPTTSINQSNSMQYGNNNKN